MLESITDEISEFKEVLEKEKTQLETTVEKLQERIRELEAIIAV